MIDKLLLEHVGLPQVLYLAVHLVNFFGWMSQGGNFEQLLFFALFYQSTPSCLKVRGGWGGVGGPCDFSVSPSPFGLDFGTLDYGTSDLGLTKTEFKTPQKHRRPCRRRPSVTDPGSMKILEYETLIFFR